MVLGRIWEGRGLRLAGFGVTCGSTVDVPQGGECKVTFKIKNTGYLTASGDWQVLIYDKNGAVVGEDTGTYSVSKGEEVTITTDRIKISDGAAIGLGRVTVIIYKGAGAQGNVLDSETCNIVNIVSGVAAEITSISVTKV